MTVLLPALAAVAALTCAPCRAQTAVAADCPLPAVAIAEPAPSPEKSPLPDPTANPAPATADERGLCTLTIDAFMRNRAGFVVADVRERGARSRTGIPGALALDVADIAQKGFLQDANLVLTGSGIDDAVLLGHCAALRRGGIARVSVLQGGVRALLRHGQTLAGNGDDLANLDWFSAEDLHRFAAHTPARVVLWGIDAAIQPPATLADAARLPADAGSTTAALQKHAGSEPGAMLVAVTATKESALALQATLRAANANNIFVMRDGLPAYTVWLDTQQRIAAASRTVLKHPCGRS